MSPRDIVLAWSLITFLLGCATIAGAIFTHLSRTLATDDARWKIAVAAGMLVDLLLAAVTIASMAFGLFPAFVAAF